MKTLNKFILKSYIGPFVMTFFIAMFVFFMMFIFKYIDDFVGKGLSVSILSRLFFYFSLTTIPMALPLAILLSSLMTFGNLGEHFELSAMKSSGLSLQRIMRPLIISIVLVSIGAFYFSNNILPVTNLKTGALLYDVRDSKPALLFKEGVFNNSIEGFTIRVGKKDKDGNTLNDLLIYDHRALQGNNIVLHAEKGRMAYTPDKHYMVLTLQNGVSYKEMRDKPEDIKKNPMMRDKFKERVIRFDMTEFKMTRTNEDLFKNNAQMLTINQLKAAIDSLSIKKEKRKVEFAVHLKESFYLKSTTYLTKQDSLKTNINNSIAFEKLNKAYKLNIIETATNIARSAKAYTESIVSDYKGEEFSIVKMNIELHRKFTLSIACLVLFFIGAPLGAIIRKGGLGMPVVISVVFFIIFHILSITGEKLAKEEEIPAWIGMWMATAILFPMGVFLTYKATADSSMFDTPAYLNYFKNFFMGIVKRRNYFNEKLD